MKSLALVSVFAVFAGCAAQPQQQASATTTLPCEAVYKVGSHLPQHDCSSSAPQSEAERQRTIDALREATKGGAKPAGGGG